MAGLHLSISHSRLNSLGILHPCAKTNEPKNMNTIIAIVRSLENTKEKIKNKSESPSENTKRMNLHTTTPDILSLESLDSSYQQENIFPLIFKLRKNSIIVTSVTALQELCRLQGFKDSLVPFPSCIQCLGP